MTKRKSRIDVIGQNGNDGEHYEHMPDGRWNWYGEGESDATSMDDDLPSAAEDCAKTRGNYEI